MTGKRLREKEVESISVSLITRNRELEREGKRGRVAMLSN